MRRRSGYSRRSRGGSVGRPGTFVYGLSREDSERLREIAAVLGFKITHGAGTGEGGSMGALLRALTEAYGAAPDRVLHGLGLVLQRPWSLPGQYRLQEEEPDPPHIVAYAPLRLTQPAVCSDCGREVAGEAWREQWSDGRQGAVVCEACTEN